MRRVEGLTDVLLDQALDSRAGADGCQPRAAPPAPARGVRPAQRARPSAALAPTRAQAGDLGRRRGRPCGRGRPPLTSARLTGSSPSARPPTTARGGRGRVPASGALPSDRASLNESSSRWRRPRREEVRARERRPSYDPLLLANPPRREACRDARRRLPPCRHLGFTLPLPPAPDPSRASASSLPGASPAAPAPAPAAGPAPPARGPCGGIRAAAAAPASSQGLGFRGRACGLASLWWFERDV